MDCYSTTLGLHSAAPQLNLSPVASFDLATDEVGLQGVTRLSLPNVTDQRLLPEDEGFGGELEGSGVWASPRSCNREAVSSPAIGLAAVSDDSYYPSAGGLNIIDSPKFPDELAALEKFLPSSNYADSNNDDNVWHIDSWLAMDLYSCDEFRMYEFKVRRCTRAKSHNWTECPFAHPGEKARRRDPRRFHYSGVACADFRKGGCERGEACEYAHGVFEYWLHPARYRTQPCRDGLNCKRRVCFFAHTVDQLRVGGSGAACARSRSNASALPSSPATLVGSDRLSVLRLALSACIACHGKDAGYEVPESAVRSGCVVASSLEKELTGDTDSDLKSPGCQAVSESLALELSDQLWGGCCSASPQASVYSPLPSRALFSPFLNSSPNVFIPTISSQDPDVPLSPPSLVGSCCSTPDLLSALQQLQLTAYSIEASQAASSPWSFEQPWQVQLPHRSRSFSKPFTKPTYTQQADKWDGNQVEGKPERRRSVESGGFLNLSKTCGRIRNQHCTEIDVPDFGWVNELVK